MRIYSQANNRACNYSNTDFVLSSAAAVEQLWSLGDKILDGVITLYLLLLRYCYFFIATTLFGMKKTVVQAYKAAQKLLLKKVATLMDKDKACVFEE